MMNSHDAHHQNFISVLWSSDFVIRHGPVCWHLEYKPEVSTSTFGPETTLKAATRTITVTGTTMTISGSTTTRNGDTRQATSTYQLDGKQHPGNTRNVKGVTATAQRLNEHTMQITFHGNGTTSRRTMTVSPNGKILIFVVLGTNAKGTDFANYSVYEKQEPQDAGPR